MINVMHDLETLGQSAGCIVLSIGAVSFDAKGLGSNFYAVVSVPDQKKAGLRTDADTVEWWEKQSPAARQVLAEANDKKVAMPLKLALDAYSKWMGEVAPQSKVRVWGNGADFDNPILGELYRVALRETPWKFWNSRCFRTLKGMAPRNSEPTRQGTFHNALDDAIHQANWAIALAKKPYNLNVFG